MSSTQSPAASIGGCFHKHRILFFHEAQTRAEEGVQDSCSSVGCAMNFSESPLPMLWTAQGSCGEVSLSRNLACDAVSNRVSVSL